MEKARFPKWVRVLTTKAALVVEKQPFICTLLSNYKLSSLFCVETRFYLKSWNEHENGWDISWKIILKNEHQFDTFYDNVQTGSLYACVKKWVFKSALHWLIDWLIESANQAKERSRRQKFQPENWPAEPGTRVREKNMSSRLAEQRLELQLWTLSVEASVSGRELQVISDPYSQAPCLWLFDCSEGRRDERGWHGPRSLQYILAPII